MKEHTQLLLEKAERAIRATRVLLDADETEFAAGRIYYAMLYVAEALLYEQGLVFRKHAAVHAAFGREFASRVSWIRSTTVGSSPLSTSGWKGTTRWSLM